MGTRAMITIEGKPFVTTHWDGYPTALGKDLKHAKSKEMILKKASKRSLNFADKEILEKADAMAKVRIKKMPKKYQAGYEWALKPNAKFVTDINENDDFQEYQYDLHDGEWRVRTVDGSWKSPTRTNGEWMTIDTAIQKEKAENDSYAASQRTKGVPSINQQMKAKGWKFEPARHALSAKGIKTGKKRR